ncbi:MAG: hypothetical protein JSR17_05010 [Proteobacteria bacterium]|nr:hypothetical protein [Pseudomonadota bacterium]
MSRYIYLLGTIQYCEENLPKLSFLGKLAFLSQWLDQDADPLTEREKLTRKDELDLIDEMLSAWRRLLPKLEQKHYRKLEDFRLCLVKDLIASLKDIEGSDKIAYAKRLLAVIKKGGVYKEDRPLTVPDPQLVSLVEKLILREREQKLNDFSASFKTKSVKTQRLMLKQLANPRLKNAGHAFYRSYSVAKKWFVNVSKLLSHLPDESVIKSKFIDSLMEAHANKVNEVFVEAPRNALYNLWKKSAPAHGLGLKARARVLFPREVVSGDALFSSTNLNDDSVSAVGLSRPE